MEEVHRRNQAKVFLCAWHVPTRRRSWRSHQKTLKRGKFFQQSWRILNKCTRAGDMGQMVECLPTWHARNPEFDLQLYKSREGGISILLSQHSGRNMKIRSSRSSLLHNKFVGQPGLHETCLKNQNQNSNSSNNNKINKIGTQKLIVKHATLTKRATTSAVCGLWPKTDYLWKRTK